MRETRVNIGMTPYINKIINKTMFANEASRSLVVRHAIRKRYNFDSLQLIKGPYNIYARINIPKEGVAYVREMAFVNDVPISAIYCAMIRKYICGG